MKVEPLSNTLLCVLITPFPVLPSDQDKSMEPDPDTISITAECLCKANAFSTNIATSKLPLLCNVCHCDSCRHITGGLHVVETTWPQPREDVDISNLQRYRFSDDITYRFCGTCSALMFYESAKSPTKLGTFSGVLKNIDADLIKLRKHIFVEDTIDGGATFWLRKPNPDGREIPRRREYEGDMPWDWPNTANKTAVESKQGQQSLPIWCHCKGIRLQLHRGDYANKIREDLPWFIDPRTNKSLASFDVCNSCRLQFGATDIIHWTFAELINISQPDGGAYPKTMTELKDAIDSGDSAVGTMTYYHSSPDAVRFFCKTCSASVFYACDDRPEIVDVAVGLLEAPDGARAESFLSWAYGDNLTWIDDTKGGWREGLMKRVQADAEEFRLARNYPKSWRRIEKEGEA